MPTSFACMSIGRAAGRRTGNMLLLAGLTLLPGASSAAAFGLEPLTISAGQIVAKDALAGLAAEAAARGADTVAADHGGLVSQDRSALDLSQLNMSAFGDAEDAVR